jgi:hypothetical protein
LFNLCLIPHSALERVFFAKRGGSGGGASSPVKSELVSR